MAYRDFFDEEASPFLRALYYKKTSEMKTLLNQGVDPFDMNGYKDLNFWLMLSESREVFKVLKDSGVIDKMKEKDVLEIIDYSIYDNQQEVWKWWLKEYPELCKKYEILNLKAACEGFNLDYLELEKRKQNIKEINKKFKPDGNTLLHSSAGSLFVDVTFALLELGADPSIKNDNGEDVKTYLLSKSGLAKNQKKIRDVIVEKLI